MKRLQLLEVVAELMDVLNKRKVSPNDASSIASIFGRAVEESNEAGVKHYMHTAFFSGSPPEN